MSPISLLFFFHIYYIFVSFFELFSFYSSFCVHGLHIHFSLMFFTNVFKVINFLLKAVLVSGCFFSILLYPGFMNF